MSHMGEEGILSSEIVILNATEWMATLCICLEMPRIRKPGDHSVQNPKVQPIRIFI